MTQKNMAVNGVTPHLTYKVVLLGDQYCGKSSIIQRYITGKYNPTYLQTIGGEFEKKKLEVEGNNVVLTIFDTMGQKDVKTITRSLFRNAQGIILVFDFSRKETLDHIKDWVDLIENHCHTIPEMILVGNKIDLSKHDIKVTNKEATMVAESHNLELVEVSAKADLNVGFIFDRIAQLIFKNRKRLFSDDVVTSIKLHKSSENESSSCCG